MRLPTSVPKPKPRTDAERLTARIANARKLEQSRKSPPKKSAPSPSRPPRKAVKKTNPERQARRKAEYKAGMAAYKKSETFKIVEKRAGGMCEVQTNELGKLALVAVPVAGYVRCDNTRTADIRLEHHHLCYSLRFGGDELPEDMLVACTPHHRIIEKSKPHKGGRPF